MVSARIKDLRPAGMGEELLADIGLAVGYDSPSKFTAAFKAVIGQTPTVHRRDRARYVRR